MKKVQIIKEYDLEKLQARINAYIEKVHQAGYHVDDVSLTVDHYVYYALVTYSNKK